MIFDKIESDEDFVFGEPWHKSNLPDFELVEGETYLVPLKLLRKERRFDGGRGTEFYMFGDSERLGRYVSFSDYTLPQIQKLEQVKDFEKRTTFC